MIGWQSTVIGGDDLCHTSTACRHRWCSHVHCWLLPPITADRQLITAYLKLILTVNILNRFFLSQIQKKMACKTRYNIHWCQLVQLISAQNFHRESIGRYSRSSVHIIRVFQ